MSKSVIWRLLYPRWRTPAGVPVPGYALMLLMPGDLPLFLGIAARVFEGKRTGGLVETLVIPDAIPPGFRAKCAEFAARWPHGAVRLVEPRALDRLLIGRLQNPHLNCWLQLVNGVEAARAAHALWHDADLFVLAPDFFEAHYARCARDGLACLGVSPAWDDWFGRHGLGHVTATWEMMFDLAWVRRFRPWQHRGHVATLAGEPHTVDISFLPQALTPPEQVGRHGRPDDFVHFNYVICTYRHFQKSRGPFEDEYFRILLIRLLIDAFDPGDWPYDAPTRDELTRGLTDPSRRVTYRGRVTAEHYDEFRGKLQCLLDGPILDADQAERIARGVQPFDRAFSWSGCRAASVS